MITGIDPKLVEFLEESNIIESEYRKLALHDAVLAWNTLLPSDTLTINLILDVHKALMDNINPRIAGRLRNCNVRVGRKSCPDHVIVYGLLSELLKKPEPKTEEEIKNWHIEFEHIHPFEDGNGRTGRILLNWQRIKNNLPLLIIHHGKEQMEYYKWFK